MRDESELEQEAKPTALDAAHSVFDWQVAWTRPKPLSAVAGAPRVLVVGIVPSLTWSVTRCLSRAGMRPVVMGWHRFSPLSLLPDCTYVPMRSLRWNDDEIDPSAIDEIARVCRVHAIDKVMPVDFPTVMLLSRYGDAISGTSVAAVPQADTMLALHNKWQFSRAIERMGLPQPRTELARCRADLLSTRLAFPIVTKPVDRWASAGFRIHDDAAALARLLDTGKLGADFPLLAQEYIPGRDVGFAFLARHGQLVAHVAFEQTRRGARRCYDAPVLQQYVAKLLAATSYHGIGEVDARYDPKRDAYRLLEVNPRFWTSLLYAERAGVNFPELLVHLDDLDDDLGVAAEPEEVRLSPYEVMVAKSVQLTERAHNTLHGWLRG
jgi:predicted ATP-grasp superfamily ATP-dependent carboligase